MFYCCLDGAETWIIRKTDRNKLVAFDRKILRTIFGAVKDTETNGEYINDY